MYLEKIMRRQIVLRKIMRRQIVLRKIMRRQIVLRKIMRRQIVGCSKLYRNDAISRKVHIVARLREDKK